MIIGAYILIAVLLSGGYLLWRKVSYFDTFDFQPDEPRPGLILGAALRGSEPSTALRERLHHALRLFEQGWVSEFICSGGGYHNKVSEAEVMRDYLKEHGVPAEAIVTETDSINTLENLRHTSNLLKKRNNDSQIYLITHNYHMFRALISAERAGVHAHPAPFASKHMLMPYHKARECLALIKLFFNR
ncbi:DUF218 domain-containing protein [Marininema mesophilum]|uniref:DUF218 domain-containing protein n=1 Tax=Marininema mesophilum TaxID=1048340 RepID=A0A1H2Z6V4_9BACL|nr:YdcF family protein [Marininema mesophilum]SDX12529.1 DUF218 domain-containing protein [Marininema mesophilum]